MSRLTFISPDDETYTARNFSIDEQKQHEVEIVCAASNFEPELDMSGGFHPGDWEWVASLSDGSLESGYIVSIRGHARATFECYREASA